MTEKPYTPTTHERESTEAREALWQALGKPDKLYEIASALTAAEERGRRAGIEENDKLRDLLRRSLDVISPYDTMLWQEIHRAVHLAPRDSAPICDNCKRAAAAKDGRTEHGIEIGSCYCVTLRAPRDSGKEG